MCPKELAMTRKTGKSYRVSLKATGVFMSEIIKGENTNDVESEKAAAENRVRDCVHQLEKSMTSVLLNFLQVGYIKNLSRVYAYLKKMNPEVAESCKEGLSENLWNEMKFLLAGIDPASPETLAAAAHILESSNLCSPDVLDEYREASSQTSENFCDNLIQEIDSTNPLLSYLLDSVTVLFKDVLRLPDRNVQTLMRELDNDTLRHALVDADKAILAKFQKNMSRRAAKMLEEDIACAKVWQAGSVVKVIECRSAICHKIRHLFGWNGGVPGKNID